MSEKCIDCGAEMYETQSVFGEGLSELPIHTKGSELCLRRQHNAIRKILDPSGARSGWSLIDIARNWISCKDQIAQSAEENQILVGKLPFYYDTGKPFVPGAEDCWIVHPLLSVWSGSNITQMSPIYFEEAPHWRVRFNADLYTDDFFSTKEAAKKRESLKVKK